MICTHCEEQIEGESIRYVIETNHKVDGEMVLSDYNNNTLCSDQCLTAAILSGGASLSEGDRGDA